jgi:hypothetical protein
MADRHLSPIPLTVGGSIGVARVRDLYTVAIDSGALMSIVNLKRHEGRQLALALLDESQRELFEEES